MENRRIVWKGYSWSSWLGILIWKALSDSSFCVCLYIWRGPLKELLTEVQQA